MLKAAFGVLVTALVAWPCLAQAQQSTAPDVKGQFYRLDFVMKELDGARVTNSRTYSIITTENTRDSIRTGARVPIAIGQSTQNIDLGVSIDCQSLKELGNLLSMRVIADVSSMAEERGPNNAPIVRQNKWDCHVLLPLRHATVLFSSDDPSSTRKMQLELTATPVQ